MAKVIDITDKLSFDENPKLKIKGIVVTVNADAETMLKIMGAFGNESEMQASLKAYDLMFSEKDRKKINGLKLPARSLMTLIQEAMNLVMGEGDSGEDQTRTTT